MGFSGSLFLAALFRLRFLALFFPESRERFMFEFKIAGLLAALGLHGRHFRLGGTHDNLGQNADDIVFHLFEHTGEHLEGFALIFLFGFFRGITTQLDTLAEIIHGRQVLLPMAVEGLQQDTLFEIP